VPAGNYTAIVRGKNNSTGIGLVEVYDLTLPTLVTGTVDYTGPYPEPSTITYTANGQTVNVTAYPGQALVFFDSPISESDAAGLINANGGTILGKIPMGRFYLVGVGVGTEATFIAALAGDPRVRLVGPNVFGTPSSSVSIIDNCQVGGHGGQVKQILEGEGGKSNGCNNVAIFGRWPGDKVVHQIFNVADQNTDGAILMNLSGAGGQFRDSSGNLLDYAAESAALQKSAQDSWLHFIRYTLAAISNLPAAARENLVITIAAGNSNMPITDLLSQLRGDSRITSILKNNVLIVSTTLMTNPAANFSTSDPDVAIRDNPDAVNGTSFAAPGAMAIIQNIMSLTGANAQVALNAAKQAAGTNANHKLIQAEAIDKARAIIAAQQTDPPGASTVTGIAFLAGQFSSAVITPAISGVTVSYTVSGTDGYYDSGTEQTSASGTVSFFIPPGAPGVTDTISVTAVLSGRVARTTHTW
jgi:hypothetical protein